MLKSNEFYLSILHANWWPHMREMSVTNFFNHTTDKIPIFFWIFILYPAVQLEAKPSSVFVTAFEAMTWRGFALGVSKRTGSQLGTQVTVTKWCFQVTRTSGEATYSEARNETHSLGVGKWLLDSGAEILSSPDLVPQKEFINLFVIHHHTFYYI